MTFNVMSKLFDKIDTATTTFVTDISSKLIGELTPVITVSLTIFFLFYGLLTIHGVIQSPVIDFIRRTIKIGFVVGIALSAGTYQSQIADVIRITPDALATALISNPVQGSGAANVIDNAAENGFKVAGEAFENAGMFSSEGIAYAFFGLLVVLATAIFCAVGGAFILLAKVALALCAGFGPLFISLLLFEATKGFFESWVGQIANYSLMTVLMASVFGFLMNIYGAYMADVNFDGVQSFAGTLGGCLILSLASLIIIVQIPSIATGLSNGLALQTHNVFKNPLSSQGGKSSNNSNNNNGGGGGGGSGSKEGGGTGAVGKGSGSSSRGSGYFKGSGRKAA